MTPKERFDLIRTCRIGIKACNFGMCLLTMGMAYVAIDYCAHGDKISAIEWAVFAILNAEIRKILSKK